MKNLILLYFLLMCLSFVGCGKNSDVDTVGDFNNTECIETETKIECNEDGNVFYTYNKGDNNENTDGSELVDTSNSDGGDDVGDSDSRRNYGECRRLQGRNRGGCSK